MAVILENENGWFICSKTYFNKIYDTCIDENFHSRKLKLKDIFFEITTPFLMNSASQKIARVLLLKEKFKDKKRVKTKKHSSKRQLYDDEINAFVINGTNSFITAVQRLGYLEDSEVTAGEWLENNRKARAAASEVLKYDDKYLELKLSGTSSSSDSVIKTFCDTEYALPAYSSFHLCDIFDFFSSVDEKYDLIVLDPPWINKSVKRKHSYCQVTYESLKNLPLEKITNPGCLIVVWLTNSSSTSSFVLNELFPKCNVNCSVLWHWSKVTKKGHFVYPVESHHRKPYENLLLGRVAYNSDSDAKPSKEIDSKKLIVSVPSSIHSHKPPLVEILKPFLIPNANCLELFARYLLPGWKSVGNEVLKLQNLKLFDPTE